MKVRIIQPAYSTEQEDLQKDYDAMVALMRSCNEPLDIIVLPEYCDVPAAVKGRAAFLAAHAKYGASVLAEAVEMAKRCHSLVFINCAYGEGEKLRNTTHAISRDGRILGRYFKAHPAPREDKSERVGGTGLDSSYTFDSPVPYVLEAEGLRFGFLTCYDFYMYEEFAQLARQDLDIIIGCSHQRTDTHSALEIINRFLSYNTNAYLLRSSVSLGAESPVGGGSCVIAPDGEVLADMKNDAGYVTVEIDPKKKYYKPAGFRNPPKAHYQYIEEGRRPWLYRNGGAGVVQFDAFAPYPRLCAHRGFNSVAPENTLPAYGAAVALGADEIEFDLWSTKDGVIVSCHDNELSRVSNGTGKITETTYEDLLKLDFGVKYGPKFAGLRIPTFEDVLRRFASRTIMNIHVKIWDCGLPDDKAEEIVALIRKYDCERHCYFMTFSDAQLRKMKEAYPLIGTCLGEAGQQWDVVDRAIAMGADKVQLFKPYFNQEMIDKAHAHGIRCNVFWADDPDEAKRMLDMGVDCILTNDFLAVQSATATAIAKKRAAAPRP